MFETCSPVSLISHSSLELSSYLFAKYSASLTFNSLFKGSSFDGLRNSFGCWKSGSIEWKGSSFSKPSIPLDPASAIRADFHPFAMIYLPVDDVRWLYTSISQFACNGFRTETFSFISMSPIGTFPSNCFPISLLYHSVIFFFHQGFERTIYSQV